MNKKTSVKNVRPDGPQHAASLKAAIEYLNEKDPLAMNECGNWPFQHTVDHVIERLKQL